MRIYCIKMLFLFLFIPFHLPLQASCGPNKLIGSVCWMAGPYCPRGYMQANGASISITNNPALFSLLGTQFGGDGRVSFSLPDLIGRVAIGSGTGPGFYPRNISQSIGLEQSYIVSGDLPGAHQLTLSDLVYNGTVTAVSETGNSNDPQNRYPAQSAIGKLYAQSANGFLNTDSTLITNLSNNELITDPAGSDEIATIALREPQLGLTACISFQGVYPQRP